MGKCSKSAKTSIALQSHDGFLRTGDIFHREGDCYYYLSRKKRVLSRGGEKVYPALIENRLRSFDGIQEVWVEGMEVARMGQAPKAYIVASVNLSTKEMIRHLRLTLPSSHIPVDFCIVDKLPITAKHK